MSHLGIQAISSYIPTFIECCQQSLTEWQKADGPVEMNKAVKKISFDIITRMAFGDDIATKLDQIEMENMKTGELESMGFFEAFYKLSDESIQVKLNPFTVLFP